LTISKAKIDLTRQEDVNLFTVPLIVNSIISILVGTNAWKIMYGWDDKGELILLQRNFS
jgi:hypothetical protein